MPPPGETWKYASTPFDPVNSDHATHVAGIAAGDYTVNAVAGRGPLSGVAPRAYIGNYKALTVPTSQFGLDGNAPEIAAAVEAAVADGMDVINLSLGEPEIEPARDVVVAALNGAAKAGVVPTIAAGNEFGDAGNGSVSSPGSAEGAITAAAVTKSDIIAPFSSAGPTPISLEMKPDVSAPGVAILSSVPPRVGLWSEFSGTSMAAPHVAGAAALLLQRHPGWTVEQVKSALELTGRPVLSVAQGVETPTIREGGGLIYLPTANNPLIFAEPTGISFGLVKVGTKATRTIRFTDAGGGSGPWTVSVAVQDPTNGVSVTAPTSVIVPGSLAVQASVAARGKEADVTGFVVLHPRHRHAARPLLAAQRAPAARQAVGDPAQGRDVQGQHEARAGAGLHLPLSGEPVRLGRHHQPARPGAGVSGSSSRSASRTSASSSQGTRPASP